MARIAADGRWDVELQKYVPENIRIEGEGNIDVSYEFMNDADPAYVSMKDGFITIGPYRLEIILQSRQIDGAYTCRLVPPPPPPPSDPPGYILR